MRYDYFHMDEVHEICAKAREIIKDSQQDSMLAEVFSCNVIGKDGSQCYAYMTFYPINAEDDAIVISHQGTKGKLFNSNNTREADRYLRAEVAKIMGDGEEFESPNMMAGSIVVITGVEGKIERVGWEGVEIKSVESFIERAYAREI